MKRTRALPFLVLFALLATPELAAADAAGAARAKLSQRLSLDLAKAAPADVFASFGKILGLPVIVDEGVATPITIRLHQVSVETSLRAICESIDCVWSLGAGALVVSPVARVLPAPEPGPRGASPTSLSDLPTWNEPLSLSLADAGFGVVLSSFAKILGVPIDVAPDLAAEKVTIELQQVPARDAVTALLELVGAELVEVSAEPRRLAVRRRR